jgi:hypothetical protein
LEILVKSNASDGAAIEAKDRSWTAVLAQYRQPNPVRSTVEIAVTALPFVALWTLCAVAAVHGFWWGLLLTIPAAGFLVRLFILQHDCGHGTLFARRGINDWTGRVIGVFTLRPTITGAAPMPSTMQRQATSTSGGSAMSTLSPSGSIVHCRGGAARVIAFIAIRW